MASLEGRVAIDDGEFLYSTFPKGFIWGMGTSAAQCEGGWDADGRGPSIWDVYNGISDNSDCKVALDSYHHYKQDVQMLKAIGASVYRFSLSWSRILANGRIESVNPAGIDYYNSLISELLANGIQPMITIYHWDLPEALQNIGGWLNEEIVDLFGQFARLCFTKFGDRVKWWTTVNEPFISGMMSYSYELFAPLIDKPQTAEYPYQYVHNQLKAHAQAYRIYEKEFKKKQKGVVGITVDTSGYLPDNPESSEDMEAADRAFVFRMGWILDPLVNGKYPKRMRDLIDRRSSEEGRDKSRLPEFDEAWTEKVKGSFDFIGINYYNAELVRDNSDGKPIPNEPKWASICKNPFFSPKIPGWNMDMETYRCHDPKWTKCGAAWQNFAPSGIRSCIKWVSDNYGKPTIMVTETGCSASDYSLDDVQREEFFRLSINAVLKSIKEDGCDVVGYVGWSLLDVWEWSSGNTVGFGIVNTDKTSPNMTRTLKNSGKYIGTIFRNNGFPKETAS